MSRYDLEISYQNDWDLAEACGIACKFGHISYGKSRIAWLEGLLKNGNAHSQKREKRVKNRD